MSRAEAKARTRERLLDSARAVFSECGFNGAAIEDIAERAGFTRGAFYANFADKADALLTLYEHDMLQSFDDLRGRLEGAGPDGAVAEATAWFENLFGERPLQQAVDEYLPAALRDAEARQRLENLDRQILEVLTAAVEAGAGPNTLPIPTKEFALMGFAVGNGIARIRAVNPHAVRAGLFVDTLVYLWTGIEATRGDPATAFADPDGGE